MKASRNERRVRAPHPGPAIATDYLSALGLDARAFAAIIGMDGDRLAAMLAGTEPINVDAAVRFGRSLGLPPERIMRAQLRHDFEQSREREDDMPLPPSDTLAGAPFPPGAMRGYLARVDGVEGKETLYFVQTEGDGVREGDLDRVQQVGYGDRLRIYAADGTCVWAGPLLQNLDGTPLFAFARRHVWEVWFKDGWRADYSPAQ